MKRYLPAYFLSISRVAFLAIGCVCLCLPGKVYAQCNLTLTNSSGGTLPGTLTVASSSANFQRIRWYKDGVLVATQEATWNPMSTVVVGSPATVLTSPALYGYKDTVYITDYKNRIYKWWPGLTTPNRIVGNAAGTAGAPPTGVVGTSGAYVDGNNKVYIAEWDGKRADKLDVVTNQLTIRAGNGQFPNCGISVLNDTVYTAEYYQKRVMMFPPGNTTGIARITNHNMPTAVNFYKDTMFVIYEDGNLIKKFPRGASTGITVGGSAAGGSGPGDIKNVQAFYIDRLGNLFIPDRSNHRIMKWAPGAASGIMVAGTGIAGTALNELNVPNSVWISDKGYMYVCGPVTVRVQEFAPTIANTQVAATPGEYKAVTDGFDGCLDSISITIIGPPAQPGNFLAFKASVCKEDTGIVYNINKVIGATSYTWSYTPATGITITQLSDTAIKINFGSSAASGTLSVIAANAGGQSPARTAGITVNDLPVVTLTPSGAQSVCQGDSLQLSAAATGTVSYQWQYGTTNVGTNAAYFAKLTGTYQVTVTNTTTACTAKSAQSTTLTVNAPPVATITPSVPVTFCAGGNVAFTANAGNNYTYVWKNGIVNIGTGNAYTATTGGLYKVVVTDNNTGCKDSTSPVNVTVLNTPVVSLSPIHAAFCDGDVVTAQVITQDTGLTYTWLDGTSVLPGATANFLQIRISGTYSVIARLNTLSQCIDTTNVIAVVVYPSPIPVVVWDGKWLYVDKGYAAYQWNIGLQAIPGATDATYKPMANDGYSVTVTDSNGCSNVSLIRYVNNVGVDDIAAISSQVKIYPNPASNIVYIQSSVAVSVSLTGMDGRRVLFGDNVTQVNISGLADGIYLLQVMDKEGRLIKYDQLVKRSW